MADYSDLDPTALRASLSDGTRLKKSITTDLYTSGTPTAANQVKPSIMYPSGTLKESVANAAGLKPSWLIAGAVAVNNDFITEWSITDNGTAAQRTITLPTTGTGYLDTTIDWGDGTVETGLADADLPFSHEYAAGSGTTTPTITVSIGESGAFPRWYFNSAGDKDKITNVTNWGAIGTTSAYRAFYGCTNLTDVASGAWNATNWSWGFHNCTSLQIPTGLFSGCDATTTFDRCFVNNTWTELFADTFTGCSAVTAYSYLCDGNSNLTTVHANQFSDSVLATQFGFTYNNCSSLAVIPSGHLDGTIGENFQRFCLGCSSLVTIPSYLFPNTATNFDRTFVNTAIVTIPTNLIGTASPTSFIYMFDGSSVTTATDVGDWDISALTAATFMFNGCTINTTDYNAMLVGWEAQTEPTGISFHGGNSTHSGAGTTARGVLTGTSTWSITDGGAA